MSDLSSLLQGSGESSQTELLVQSFRQTEQPKLNALSSKKQKLERKSSFYNTLKSKLDTLVSQLDIHSASTADSKFFTKKSNSTDTAVLTASASDAAVLGISNVRVDRLATNDILIADQMKLEDEFKQKDGTYDFSITVGDDTFDVSVTLIGDETNEEAMQKIIKAVNATEDITITAAYVKDTSTTGRLTFTSEETGEDNRIEFNDKSQLLKEFGLGPSLKQDGESRTEVGDTKAGYKTASVDTLNSLMEINGVKVTRGSNSVEDAMSGVTLNLNKPQDPDDLAITVKTEVNSNAVEEFIKPLLDSYNDILTYLKSQKDAVRGDSTTSSLYSRFRGLVSSAVTSTESSDDPRYLTEAGITIGNNGTLSVTDYDKLEGLLEDDPQKVANLFTSSDGFAAKLNSAIQSLSGNDGLITARTTSLASQIDQTQDRYEEMQKRIDQRADALRKEYNSVLEVYYQAQNQYSSFLQAFQQGFGSTTQ
jgi:flagellar hook-associated protein 2